MSGEDHPDGARREPLAPALPAEPGDDPLELTLDWGHDGDDLPPLGPSSLTWREPSHPTVASYEEDEIWVQRDATTGASDAAETHAPVARRRPLWASFRLWLVLGAIAAVAVAALALQLRAADSSPRSRAGGVGPAGLIVPTTPPPTSAPAATTSSSTSTSTSSSTVLPSSTTAQPAGGASAAYGPLCGFLPGSAVAIELNGEPAGTLTADADSCVTGRVVAPR